MKNLPVEVIQFFQSQGCVIVSTIDRNGMPHNSCKGIVRIEEKGKVYLLDLYRAKTYENLKHNPNMNITAVDEHRFTGYCLKGIGRIIEPDKIALELIEAWEDRLTHRLTRRILRNIHEEKGHNRHPEALLPRPKYLILLEVAQTVDLTPHSFK